VTSSVDQTHFWYRVRRDVLAAALEAVAPRVRPGSLAIDLGCGAGTMLATMAAGLPQATVVGVDGLLGGLTRARDLSGAPVVAARFEALPFARPAALIGAFDVLEHLDDDDAALVAAHDALEPGGTLLATVPAHHRLWSDFDVASGHRRRYEPDALRRVITGAGFEVLYLTPLFTLLAPAARLRRSRPSGAPVEPGAVIAREVRIGGVANRLLYGLLRHEARAVRRRRRLPFGTSLLVEARAR
jgi:SAM-dependent methyltransferase